MRFNTPNELKMELVSTTSAYVTGIEGFHMKCPIGKFQDILETVSFFFEAYRDEFIRLGSMRISNLHLMDEVVFISWCSCETVNLIKDVYPHKDIKYIRPEVFKTCDLK